MTGTWSVQTGRVHTLSADLLEHSKAIRAALDDLEQKVSRLVAQWDGSAQESYRVAQTSWDKSAAEMQQFLSEIGNKTSSIADRYTQGDNASASRFQ